MRKFVKTAMAMAVFSASGLADAAYRTGEIFPQATVSYRYTSSVNPQSKAALEQAIQFYKTNTQLNFIDITNQPIPYDRTSYFEVTQYAPTGSCISIGHQIPSWGFEQWFSGDARLEIGYNTTPPNNCVPSPDLMKHELFHVLGFLHEHNRRDAPTYVELNPAKAQDENYKPLTNEPWYPQPFGNYDFDSVMNYNEPQNFARKDSQDDNLQLAKEVGNSKYFRIMVEDGTPNTSFDNSVLNNENGTGTTKINTSINFSTIDPAAVDPNANKATAYSGMYYFEYTGSGNVFRIKHRWANQYLSSSSTANTLLFTTTPSIPNANWELTKRGDAFVFKNVGSGKYIRNNGTAISMNTDLNQATSWLLKIGYNEQYTFSQMDYVALHWMYGFPFRLKINDATPNTLNDNLTLHSENYGPINSTLNVTPGPIKINSDPNSNLGWFSSRWFLERVPMGGLYQSNPSKWVRIKNDWYGNYLHTERGVVQLNPQGTMNSSGVELVSGWWSAQWELIIKKDYFLIKNRSSGAYLYNNGGVLATGTTPNDNYKWSFQAVERSALTFNY